MKYFLDTNIFLRYLISDNEVMSNECKKLFVNIEQGKIDTVTSFYVLTEVIWVCLKVYKLPKIKVTQALRAFRAMGIEMVENSFDFFQALDWFEKQNVKFVDCLIASVISNSKGGFKLLSYDKDFDKLQVKRLEPKDLI